MITLTDGRAELYQWDTGRVLNVPPECTQVHYSNKVFGRSLDVEAVDGKAIVPDVLLQSDKDIFVWAFVGSPENGYTKISKTFKVNRRSKPNDYVFTPTEQITLEELSKRLDIIEDSVNPEIIKETVDSYISENPPEESDPTVPDWAKAESKPEYASSEIKGLDEDLNKLSSDLKKDFGKSLSDLSEHLINSLKPRLYPPSIPRFSAFYETIFEIRDDTRNNGMSESFNVFIDDVFVGNRTSNGVEAVIDIYPYIDGLSIGYHKVTATALGGGFGIEFRESEKSGFAWYLKESESGTLAVKLKSDKTSETVIIDGEYDTITINGIDGLTDAVNSVIRNDDNSITFNYEASEDMDIIIHYTIRVL